MNISDPDTWGRRFRNLVVYAVTVYGLLCAVVFGYLFVMAFTDPDGQVPNWFEVLFFTMIGIPIVLLFGFLIYYVPGWVRRGLKWANSGDRS